MNQLKESGTTRSTSSAIRFRPVLLLGLTLVLMVASGCRQDEVAEDPAIQPPGTYVAPPSEVSPAAAANRTTDGPASRNAPAVPQSTGDEAVDKPDPSGD